MVQHLNGKKGREGPGGGEKSAGVLLAATNRAIVPAHQIMSQPAMALQTTQEYKHEILYFHFNFLIFSVCHEIMFSMINPSICKSRSIPSFSVDHLQPKMWRKLCQRTYKIRRHSDNTDENSKYTYHLKWTGDMNPYFESGKMGV